MGGIRVINGSEIHMYIKREMFKRMDRVYKLSIPVLRVESGELKIAVFVIYYDSKNIIDNTMPYPSAWILCNVNSGEIRNVRDCEDESFYEETGLVCGEGVIDISTPIKINVTSTYVRDMYRILDTIRYKYITTGVVDKDKYDTYLKLVLNIIPKEYRIFYSLLSNIGTDDE